MKREGILNSEISRVLSYMGHTDRIAIGGGCRPGAGRLPERGRRR